MGKGGLVMRPILYTICLMLGAVPSTARPPIACVPVNQVFERVVIWNQTPAHLAALGAGPSMSPYLLSGDILLETKCSMRTALSIGMFAVYANRQGVTVCHEIVGMRPGYILTKGIGNQSSDGWVSRGRVLAVVLSVIRPT